MNQQKQPISRLINWMVLTSGAIIALVPFHALLTVWLTSIIGGYTAVRLWKEYLLLVLTVLAVYVCCTQAALWRRVRREPLLLLIGLYVLLLLLRGAWAVLSGNANGRAAAYGILLDGRFLVFFVIVWFVSQHTDLIVRWWRQLLLLPASLVAGFAALQYFILPPDVLKHFGYGPDTIMPVATVDQKITYQRVQSTLRGANPLGAYLVVIISAISVLIVAAKRLRWWLAGIFVLCCIALVVTFSRSAWIGIIAAASWLIWVSATSYTARRVLLVAGSVAILTFVAVGYALQDNDRFQNVFFHTDEHSAAAESSNAGRMNALQAGVQDIVSQPLGRGTGTAGPASVYNDHPARLAENYYLQLGQEVGVIGLVLFAAINLLVGLGLWWRRQELLPRVLLASLIGITVVNMLSHAWTDDTLAYIWWGLAGAALAVIPANRVGSVSDKRIIKHNHD